MRVAIIGGTGFVGHYLVRELLQRNHEPRLLVRPGSEDRVEGLGKDAIVTGTVEDQDALNTLLEGADAVIYNIGILRENPKRGITFKTLQQDAAIGVMAAAQSQGVRRFLLMSANGIDTLTTPYQRTKWAAEQHLIESTLEWTIFRPSVIFGDPHGRNEFASQLARDVIDSPLPAPLFFPGLLALKAGQFELAPVHVEDVANAFVTALDNPQSIGQVYTLCGPEALSWKTILTRIADTYGRGKLMLPVPALGVAAAAKLLDRFESFPITRDQIAMLLQGNTCSHCGLEPLGIDPRPFDTTHLAYLNERHRPA